MQRRSFLNKASLILASAAGIFAGFSLLRIFSQRSGNQGMMVKIGKPSDFPVDTYTLVVDHDLFIYRDHEGIKALSSICTHLGCTVQRSSDGFECPCHGSCYTEEGKVKSGPAPRSLSWYEIDKAADGRIQVDKSSEVDAAYKYSYS